MTENRYSAADIKVLDFIEHIRRRPGMYFSVGPDNPALATHVLHHVLGSALHPDARLAPDHTLRVSAEISANLAFAVTDDQAGPTDSQGMPALGYYDSLLGPDRLWSAAAAALSHRAVVEVWRDGRGLRQVLAAMRPETAPKQFEPPHGSGTRVAFELDPDYFSPLAAISSDLGSLDLHRPHCAEGGGSGHVVIRDLRTGAIPAEWHYS
ncbi:DNA topoisomerase IV subunit B family protein [Kitasatospora mediocidica]|uniref:hypothetical protein n=1 Tax=Kitasatospora mediocidica TaxID=58352 RepID=UPI00055E185F|nr:hypothetical protein [Kitasatospora mediocidica]